MTDQSNLPNKNTAPATDTHQLLLDALHQGNFDFALGLVERGEMSLPDMVENLKICKAGLEAQSNELKQAQQDALEASQRHLMAYFDASPLGMATTSPEKNWIVANNRFCELLGYSREELSHTTWVELTHPDDMARDMAQFNRVMAQEINSYSMDKRFLRKDGRVLDAHLSVHCVRKGDGSVDYFIALIDDISWRKQVEKRVLRLNNLYATLSDCNDAIVHCANEKTLFQIICQTIVQHGVAKIAWIGLLDNANQTIQPAFLFGEGAEYLQSIKIFARADLPYGRSPTSTAIREKRPCWHQDFLGDPNTTELHEQGARYGWHSAAALPIFRNGQVTGALTLYSGTVADFDMDARHLFTEMAMDIGFALDNLDHNAVRENALARLEENKAMLEMAGRMAHMGAWSLDIPEMRITCSNEVCAIHEIPAGTQPTLEQVNKLYNALVVTRILDNAISTGEPFDEELQLTTANNNLLWVRVLGQPVRNSEGKVIRLQGALQDISQRKHDETEKIAQIRRIENLSHYDQLTGLPNQTLLEDRIATAITHAQLHRRYIAIIFLDLDHFRAVNDTFGRVVGDMILTSTAKRLLAAIPAPATVTHLFADTFVIALPDLNTSEEINRIADFIAQRIYQPFSTGEQQIQLSVRMGIAVYPLDGEDADSLLSHADAALAQAKKSAEQNKFCFYSASMNEHARRLVSMSAELRSAIEQNRLVLYYQPQVDIINGNVIGAEALIRINNTNRGIISPEEFISIAEETGLIIPIGEWVIREACRQLKQWHDNMHTALSIAVNLSPLQLHQSNLAEIVKNALTDSGLEPRYLELEFTESAIMQDVHHTIAVMQQFKDMGLHLSIDDFGTGYSSLSYLKQFPVDKLKIDQAFISNISHDPNDAAIVQAIIALGRTLSMTTIAEGVETEAQLGYLRSVHCKEMQGYLYSKPLPAAEFAALLGQGKTLEVNKSDRFLLLVDDEENVLMSLKRTLRREGYTILTASNAEQALELMAQNPVNVVLSDQRMPGMSGVEFLRRVKTMHPDTVRMVLSGYTEVNTLTDAINKGEIYQFITKPWENDSLITQLREAFVRYEQQKGNNNPPVKPESYPH